LFLCGLASYYAHMYLEDVDEEDQQPDTTISRLWDRPSPSVVCQLLLKAAS
jgi:hypothetical protein